MSEEEKSIDHSPEEDDTRPPERGPVPPPRKRAPKVDEGTLSLLDLMDEAAGEGVGEEEAVDEELTPAGPPIPTKLPRPDPRPLPPTGEQTLMARPLEKDEGATHVQPRVAFPGSTRLDDKALREQPEPAGAPAQPRQVGPKREAPTQAFRKREAPQREAPRVAVPEPIRRPAPAGSNRRGCFTRVLLLLAMSLLVGAAMGTAGVVIGYTAVASDLPRPEALEERASDFETAIIYDREGNELYSLADPTTGNRTYVPLDRISPALINATIATEDARFYTNPGFDPVGIARAVWQAAQEREFVSGASTITQQLVRALLLDEEERTQRTFRRKVREIILAAELNRTYDKNKLLELYLNEIFYGNFAYGVEAAAQTYFDKSAADLDVAEASLLAGLPQAPAVYDPYTSPELALARQQQVLGLMLQEGYITVSEQQEAINTSNEYVRNELPPVEVNIRHPHFVFAVLQQLEAQLDAQALYRGGLRIHTTLDPELQRLARETVAAHEDTVANAGANNAALVAIDPRTGEVLAMVGSLDYDDEAINGQVNMALAPRQPGSAIKPLVYASALEEGWTPATLIWDVETEFPDGANPPYVPSNFDEEFHGPVRLRPALGNSYNVPAVKALEFVGVCNFIEELKRFEIVLPDEGCEAIGVPRNHGLSLALGGGEISPLELTAAFAALGNQGSYHSPVTIRRIENGRGDVQFTQETPEAAEPAVSPQVAYLISHILSDNEARQPEFGANNLLNIPGHRVAAKTGTSGANRFDVRDGWTVGYTPHIAAGVWVGNTDPAPVTAGSSGYRMAAPIWHDFMSGYLAGKEPQPFARPASVVELEACADSGTQPGPGCSEVIKELFAAENPPPVGDDDFVQLVPIDLWTGLRANEFCQEAVYTAGFVNLIVNGRPDVQNRERGLARRWLEETAAGRAWANNRDIPVPLRLPPEQSCTGGTSRPEAVLSQPPANSQIIGEVPIMGIAAAPGFSGYRLDYGLSHDPGGWATIAEGGAVPGVGPLARWQTTDIDYDGPVTLRLTVFGPDNPFTDIVDPVSHSTRLFLTLRQPTATPTATPTQTATPTLTPTPTATDAVKPTETPSPSATPSPTATDSPPVITTVTSTPSATP